MRRLLMGVAALIIMGLLAVPASAWAARPGGFNASGQLGVTGAPTIEARGRPNGVMIIARGEQLSGVVVNSTSAELQGASVAVTIDKERSNFSFKKESFRGHLEATLQITATNGDTLVGNLKGQIQGVFADPNNFILSISSSTTRFQWDVAGAGLKGKGSGTATLSLQPDGTFSGGFSLDGALRS